MKHFMQAFLVVVCLSTPVAQAVTIDAQVEGPLLKKDRVLEFVRQNLEGEIATVPDIDRGGKHRLFVRVASKHIGPKSWFLYLTEVQLQRRVTDVDTQRVYWASIRSAVLWGTVPSEIEVRDALGTLMSEKVSQWKPD
ncbi:MAG TPA: hypothetical protein VMW70_04745 [Burkholderiales bacterium]|nr:hypothetical protein [Burkholderiales bacterium]